MYFEEFQFDRAARSIIEARVGDEVFAGASVEWRGYSKADTLWMFSKIEGVLSTWSDVEADVWRLTGDADAEGVIEAYSLSWREGESWRDAGAWERLGEGERASILATIEDILTSLHALLLIL
jgi:hypothetical protein